ncbi:MAG: gluconate 2-dehydrogenase subunit 3 family protein [Bacteroidota bacterium]
MNRRKAIQQIALLSAGAVLLPSCQLEAIPVFDNIPLERPQYAFIDQLANALLPIDPVLVQNPDSRIDFILNMVNDCCLPKQIQKFIEGYQSLMQQLTSKDVRTFQDLTAEQQYDWLEALEQINKNEHEQAAAQKLPLEKVQSASSFFYEKVKQLSQQHFTSSAYFLSQHLDFEFVPSRFSGCAKI